MLMEGRQLRAQAEAVAHHYGRRKPVKLHLTTAECKYSSIVLPLYDLLRCKCKRESEGTSNRPPCPARTGSQAALHSQLLALNDMMIEH